MQPSKTANIDVPALSVPPEGSDAAASMYDWKYRSWIEALQKAGGHFITAADILDGKISRTACNLLLRHDIDGCELYANVWPLLVIEYRLGVRSTTYLFAAYDGKNWSFRRKGFPTFRKEWKLDRLDQVRLYQDLGFEFGLHAHPVGRCRRTGETVDPDEAQEILRADVARFRSLGIQVRTMAAHGFTWPDGVQPWYDNYAAEFDFTTRDPSVQSQMHVLERFAQIGRPVSGRLGVERVKSLRSAWVPRHVPLDWLHACSDQRQLQADALTLTDANEAWKHIGIRELTALIPQLPGCLVVLNMHPTYYAYGDDGLEFVPRSVQFTDHECLGGLLNEHPPASVEPVVRPKPAIRYQGKLDFDRLGPGGITESLTAVGIEQLNRQLRRINARFTAGPWFEHLINPPNDEIIAWLDEFIDPKERARLRMIEICGGAGPVALALIRHGFRPENLAVTDLDKKHLAIARALSKSDTGGKVRVFRLDVLHPKFQEQFDIAVIAGWENTYLPYDRATAATRNLVADDGLLVMTFMEKSRIESEGYDFFPDRMMPRKPYYTIDVHELMATFDRNGFEPICYIDHGYPRDRFPRHVLVGRKRPASAPSL